MLKAALIFSVLLMPTPLKADVFDIGKIDNYSCHLLNSDYGWVKIKEKRSDLSRTVAIASSRTAVTTRLELGKTWAKVMLNNGKTGMVKWSMLISHQRCGIVNKRYKLNIYRRPTIKSKIVAIAKPYSGLLILTEMHDKSKWAMVMTNNRTVGYAETQYLTVE